MTNHAVIVVISKLKQYVYLLYFKSINKFVIYGHLTSLTKRVEMKKL